MANGIHLLKQALQREQEAYDKAARLNQSLMQEYEAAARRINAKITEFYGLYASDDGGIQYHKVKLAPTPQELQTWRANLQRQAGQAEDIRQQALAAQARGENARSRIGQLQAELQLEIQALYAKAQAESRAALANVYAESYRNNRQDIQQAAGRQTAAPMPPAQMQQELEKPWSGANFEQRLQRQQQEMLFRAGEIINQGCLNGEDRTTMAKKLTDTLGMSYRAAERLVHTEAAHFNQEGAFAAYREEGVEEYEYQAENSAKTCGLCSALNGRRFKVEERQEGENAPPMHPNCRCITVPVTPEMKKGQPAAEEAAEKTVDNAAEKAVDNTAASPEDIDKGLGNPKEINIHGRINSELDEVDLVNKIIYEDKSASKLYMEKPDFPQTEAQWAYKQVYKKGTNRIQALQQTDMTLSSKVTDNIPEASALKDIKDYVFRIDADTPELRAAVQMELDNLKVDFPDYNFSATYGDK